MKLPISPQSHLNNWIPNLLTLDPPADSDDYYSDYYSSPKIFNNNNNNNKRRNVGENKNFDYVRKSCLFLNTYNMSRPRSLISTFVVRYLDSIIHILAKSKISRPQLVSLAEQAGLSLTWSKTPKTKF